MRIRWIAMAAAALVMVGFALRPALALDEVTYEALVDKTKVAANENVQYMVVIHYGIDTLVPTIATPSFDRFSILNEYQSHQASPGEKDKHLILKKMWLLRPTEPGHLSIAASIITYQDPTTNLLKTGKTQAVFVDVAPAAEEPAPAAGQAPASQPALPWPLLAGGAGVVALAVWLLLFRPKPQPQSTVPRPSLEDQALEGLQAAVARLEEDSGSLADYYASLTRTLLDYLQAKYGLDANRLSADALVAQLGRLSFDRETLAGLETFFQTAEKTKFAGYVPSEDDMIALHGTVTRFIEAGRRVKSVAKR